MKMLTNLKFIVVHIFFNFIKKLEKILFMIDGKGFGSYSINQEVQLALQLLEKKPKLAIDIGCNVGEYTSVLLKKNPNIEIHAFEPTSINIKSLMSRFSQHENVKINQLAISDKSGEAIIYSDFSGSGLGSLTKRNLSHFGIDFEEKETVNTIKFEEYWLSDLKGQQIDLVKIDIEGHELKALNGFGKAIQFIKLIQFEFGGCNIDSRSYFQDFFYFFKENDFTIYRITPLGLNLIDKYFESDEVFLTTNYLALNNKAIS